MNDRGAKSSCAVSACWFFSGASAAAKDCAGAAALGSPVNAVAWLANALGRYDIPLLAGDVILSGSLAAMIPVKRGDRFRMQIGGIGDCSVRFE